ncbi:cyclic nucleotide-binding domain-containing protein 2 isoform 1-T2 [Liasis olivaceus]
MEGRFLCLYCKENFHRLIVDIILMIKVCRCFRAGLKGLSGFHLIEKDCRGKIEDDIKSSNIVFDRHEFSVSKDHFPFRAIQITKKPPTWRTESEIKHLRNCLQLLESFRQYSPTLQYLLAKVVRFERFGRRRVIIKKGHQATAFYFIYFGTVAITDDEDGSSAFVETAPTTIHKGASFGEIALLQKTKRIATVVCMEETELLVVDKKNFFAFKLDKELQHEFKTRYEFLRNLDLFQTLPDSSIDKMANFCKIEKYYFGQVITTDLAETYSMIFITKGICEVLRLVNLSTCPSYQKWITKQLRFPKLRVPVKERKRRDAEIASVDRFKSTLWSSYSGHKLRDLKTHYLQQKNSSWESQEKQICLSPKNCKSVVINVQKHDKSLLPEPLQPDEQERVQNIISGVFRKKSAYSTAYGDMPDSVAAAVYIRLDQLNKGDYIINLEDNRIIVLVSQGVEIIRLKKEKIESWADDITTVKLSKLKVKYPSDDELCQVFLRQNAWEMFKKDLLKLVMQPKLMKMVHPPHPCPTAEVYDSWCLNQQGILDLSPLCCRMPCPPDKHRHVPAQLSRTKESLPVIQPKLVHGISVVRPNLDGAF